MTLTANTYAREITNIVLGDDGTAQDAIRRILQAVDTEAEFIAAIGGIASYAGFAVRAANRVGELGVARIIPTDLAATNASRTIAAEVFDDQDSTVAHIRGVLLNAETEQIIEFVDAVVHQTRVILTATHTRDLSCPVCRAVQHSNRISACLYPGSQS